MKLSGFATGLLIAAAVSWAGPQRGAATWIHPADGADIDMDGVVDDIDFVLFSLQYDVLECTEAAMPDDCSADLDRDGKVDDADFVIFVSRYRPPVPDLS